MATITVSTEQIAELIQQLPPAQKREVVLLLVSKTEAARAARQHQGEMRLRELAQQRGLVWDSMDEAQKELLVDEIVHEARA